MHNGFGGTIDRNKRNSRRPLSFSEVTHLTLRLKKHLPALFDPRDHKMRAITLHIANKHQTKICHLVFNHTHVHSGFIFKDRNLYRSFIREWTGALIQHFTKTIKIKFKNIFMNRPWTRAVTWGRAYKNLINYMKKNEAESGVLQNLYYAFKIQNQIEMHVILCETQLPP